MREYPHTKEAAANYRYNQWAGNPKGRSYDPMRCAYEVYDNWQTYQCQRKPVAGPGTLYCKQHAKKV